jgi:tRNA threonylcarbamoyladenosine biosynthesis protein TsaB
MSRQSLRGFTLVELLAVVIIFAIAIANGIEYGLSSALYTKDVNRAFTAIRDLEAGGIARLLGEVGWQPRDVQLIGVATGPGSFTGLRVGVTTAKMFAYAVGAEVMGVNTLEAIARQAPADIHELWAVLDAQREQVFAARFSRADDVWRWKGETSLLDNAAWLAELSAADAVTGPALAKLSPRLPPGIAQVDRTLWSPKAAAVGRLAGRQFESGRRDELRSLVPHYSRPSAAEEKRAGRG